MIYLAKTTSPKTLVSVDDVKDRTMTKPVKQIMANLRIQTRQLRRFFSGQTLPGIVTVSVK